MYDLNTIKKQNKSKAIKIIDRTKLDGGVTFDGALNVLTLSKGYTVSIANISKSTGKNIESQLNSLKSKGLEGIFGLWVDGSTWFFDENLVINNKKTALKIARKFDELAIWDNKNKKEVRL
jgi:hypothetical protein